MALVQMRFDVRREVVLDTVAGRITEAAANGAQLVCFPELATSIYFPYELDAAWQSLAEPVPGPSTDVVCAAAKEAGVDVVFPLYERDRPGELYNAAVVVNADGELVGTYRKNMIPLAHSEQMDGFEKYYFRPGNLGYPVFRTSSGLTVGIVICYERHFPEVPRILTLAGADFIVAPTATAARQDVWEIELRGHAVANMQWVAGVNRVGRDTGGGPAEFYGNSMMVDPRGKVTVAAGSDGEEIVYAAVDTDVSRQLRETYGWFRDRRPETYTPLVRP